MQANESRGDARDIVIRTERLVLTSWIPADVTSLMDMHADPDTMRYVRFGRPETHAESEQLVAQYQAEHRERGWTKWRLATHADELVGRAGFGGDDKRRSLSYTIRRQLWGQGLATEIAAALVDWHWRHAPTVPLRALVEIGNDASVTVLRKVGFEPSGSEVYGESLCQVFVHPGRP